MVSPILLILGTAVLCMALRSFQNVVLQKLGALAILATSFLIGWMFTGHISIGLFCALSWFLLPWLEILTRIRHLRLPVEKNLRQKMPPSRENFPMLDELTSDIEDAGWDWEDYQQFFRLFYKQEDRSQSAICLIDQHDVAFYYLSISSRSKDGSIWTTWNYPFSNSLKLVPELKINRLRSGQTFLQLHKSHRAFLRSNHVSVEQLEELNPDKIHDEIQKDLRTQIAHNLAKGVLTHAGEGQIRYSWRGLFYIWMQFLRDLARL